jgi:Tfp pilus assembly PilM family ATPase
LPAPCSIEISGLASLSAFGHAHGNANAEDCSVVIDFGSEVSMVAFFNKNTLSLVRKFDIGTTHILKQLQKSLGVDQDVALGILNDGSFDVTKLIHNAMEPFLQQLIISWDFVERRENTHISKLYVCGGGAGIRLWAQELESATGQVPVKWDPFAGFEVYPKVIPDELKGQESRFAAAVGAALAMMKVG